MKNLITITFILSTFQLFGQSSIFYKTIGKKNFHYIELNGDKAIVYKMGWYFDKAGSGPSIILIDTLIKKNLMEFVGKNYLLLGNKENLYLQFNKKNSLQIEQEKNIEKVTTDLNNAYCLKSYFDLSDRLNKEYPLYHYTFRNGYCAWTNRTDKNINHNQLIELTDKTIRFLYDSISTKQNNFTRMTDYITKNVNQSNYSTIIDSLKTLPIDYRPQSGYFDKCVYAIVKANPENIFKLISDFPSATTLIYFAIEDDKKLVKQIKNMPVENESKKKFMREYKNFHNMGIKTIGGLVATAGILVGVIFIIK